MEAILERIDQKAGSAKGLVKEPSLRKRLIQRDRDHNKTLMLLAGGDVAQYEMMQRMSAENFLIKFEEHIDRIDHAQKKIKR